MTFAAVVSGPIPIPVVFALSVAATVLAGRFVAGVSVVVRDRRRRRRHGGTLDLTGLSRGGPRVFVGPRVNARELFPDASRHLELVKDELGVGAAESAWRVAERKRDALMEGRNSG